MLKYEAMKKTELLELAKEHKIKGRSKMKKDELIKALKEIKSPEKKVKMNKNDKKSTTKKILEKSGAHEVIDPAIGYESVLQTPTKREHYSIPDHYDQDTIFLLPVDPENQYVYWELSQATQDKLKKELHLKESNYEIRIYLDQGIMLAGQKVPLRGDWYFNVSAPLKKVWAEIGVIDNDGKYHVILKSTPVILPSGQVSNNVDVKWMMVNKNWQEIFEKSGVNEKVIGASMAELIIKRVRDYLAASQGEWL